MVDKWREMLVMEMKRELGFYSEYNIEFIVKDANDDNNKQIRDIQDLVESEIDILIVSANEAEQLTPTVEEVFNKGIPVIIIDRKINSTKYTAYIGADNLTIGREAGLFAAELLKGKGKILEITGLEGSTPAIERSSGFREIIGRHPEISIVKTIEGKWLESRTMKMTDSLFYTFSDFDLIFAQNDFMARAASFSAKKHKIKPYIIGIDGLNIDDGGVAMVLSGTIDGTIFYPTGGDKAINLAMNILTNKSYEGNNDLNTFRIDNSNARTIWMQGSEIRSQQAKLDRLTEQLSSMSSVSHKRGMLLSLLTALIFLLIGIILITYFLLRQKNKLNKLLALKNRTINQQYKIISKQRDDSVNLLMVAEEAKENNLRLFTDLSHEFRTAATLIINPLEELIKTIIDEPVRNSLRVIHKNASRLTSLSDSILKFRNLDENKYKPSFKGSNIALTVSQIVDSFTEKAKEKQIIIIKEIPQYLYAEFDTAGMEKLMYNLMSNAVKYNKINGSVTVSMYQENLLIRIRVEDSGIGIPQADIPYIFNRFYKASNKKNIHDVEGMGVGLAMAKEFLQLTGGTISVSSFENVGSTFDVTIPQFNENSKMGDNLYLDDQIIDDPEETPVLVPDKEKTILIVEDNKDVISLLEVLLNTYYNVITASDGKEGLEIALKKVPTLIISDIIMPVMDGLQMCMQIKNNASTCHIPVVLLTALDTQEFTIKGFEIGADAYITKPFNEKLLLTHIKNLIESRKKIKNAYCPSSFFRDIFNTKDESDQEFIKKCLDIIYENAESEAFGIEELADKLMISRSSLYRKIKDICKTRPVDFIKKARLNYSAKLLLSKNLQINEIAWRSGFSDPKYFSKCFYKEFGCYPRRFSDEFNLKSEKELS
jgi:signal transduction histidine kinase/DNA-binding response OmpR family regulator